MIPIVIDLSHHNVVPKDLKAAAASGIIGCIHKATEGSSYQDSKVSAREFLVRDAGMLFGLYHFIRPGNISGQVANFLDVYRRFDSTNLLVALDYEDSGVPLSDCEDWLVQVAAATGKVPVIYSGHVLKDKLGDTRHPVLNQDNYPLWLAQYGPEAELPAGWSTYWLWQYTDDGTVPGISPPTDLNAGDEEQVRGAWTETVPLPPVGKWDFADAMRHVLDGGKACRSGWNGKGMWIAVRSVAVEEQAATPLVCMRTAQGSLVPWLASVTDMTAYDWEEVD